MRRAMAEAEVGDDVLGDDPTVAALEQRVASMLGFEAALFVPSGTMANLISIMCHCTERDSEIIVGDKCHIHLYEQGGCATLAGVHPRSIPNNPDGTIDLARVKSGIRGEDEHCPITRLICVENTHNYCGGKVLPLQYLDQLVELSKETGIPLHMDGARLANAAAALGVPMSRILRGFASSTLCLSKSLSAPVGSLIGGTKSFITRGYDCKKEGVSIDLENLHTNIILLDLDPKVILPDDFCVRMEQVPEAELAELGESVAVRMFPMSASNVRMVTHADVSREDVDAAARKLQYVIQHL